MAASPPGSKLLRSSLLKPDEAGIFGLFPWLSPAVWRSKEKLHVGLLSGQTTGEMEMKTHGAALQSPALRRAHHSRCKELARPKSRL